METNCLKEEQKKQLQRRRRWLVFSINDTITTIDTLNDILSLVCKYTLILVFGIS